MSLRFPPLPRSVAEVATLLSEQQDVPDTPRLVEIAHADPSLALTVLRRANSAFYGIPRQVEEVRQAVFLLGFLEVCNLVLASGMQELRGLLSTAGQQRIFHAILRESLGTAYLAQQLALGLDLPHQSLAYTLGLLHNAGRLVLLYNMPDDYEALWDEENAPTAEDERARLGCEHRHLAVRAVEEWMLPVRLKRILEELAVPGSLDDDDLRPVAYALRVAREALPSLLQGGHPDSDAYAVACAELGNTVQLTAEMIDERVGAQRERVMRYLAVMQA